MAFSVPAKKDPFTMINEKKQHKTVSTALIYRLDSHGEMLILATFFINLSNFIKQMINVTPKNILAENQQMIRI